MARDGDENETRRELEKIAVLTLDDLQVCNDREIWESYENEGNFVLLVGNLVEGKVGGREVGGREESRARKSRKR